jgi:hypothetical protein
LAVEQSAPSASWEDLRSMIDALYRADPRRIFATLIRLLGDFELAEESVRPWSSGRRFTRQAPERRFLEQRLGELPK